MRRTSAGLVMLLLAGCERAAPPARLDIAPRRAFGPPADAVPMREGPYRGQRLGLLCQGQAGPYRIRAGQSATCQPVAWTLVMQDTGSVTTNFAPYWHTRTLFDEPFTLVAEDTSIARTARFLVSGRRVGRTTVRTTIGGVEARIAIDVVPPMRLGYEWPVRDTVVPVGRWLALSMVLRDTTGDDVHASGWGRSHSFYADAGARGAPTVEWPRGERAVRLRSEVPGCALVTYSSGGSATTMYVHFVSWLAEVSAADSTPRPSLRRGSCSANEGPASP